MQPRIVRRAIIPATELGTRLLPATKAVPPELLPLVDRPLIQYAVEEALSAGIEEILIVTGRGKSALEDHFDRAPEIEDTLTRNGLQSARGAVERSAAPAGVIAYIRQQEAFGLGHALWCARHAVGDEPFAVLLPDEVFQATPTCLSQLIAAHRRSGGNLAAAAPLVHDRTARHGALAANRHDDHLLAVTRLTVQTSPRDPTLKWAPVGRFILDPAFVTRLRPTASGATVTLLDALAAAAGDGALNAYAFAGQHFDCRNPLGLFEANLAFMLARPEFTAAAQKLLVSYGPRKAPAAPRPVETPSLAIPA